MEPYQRLAAAVLLQAIQDAAKDTQEGAQARQWISNGDPGLTFWCCILGLEPKHVHEALRRVLAGEVDLKALGDGRKKRVPA